MWYKDADNKYTFRCVICNHVRVWWEFKNNRAETFTCFQCEFKKVKVKIEEIINMAGENNMQTLRDRLFDCIQDIKDKKINIAEAKEICHVAQTIINTVKVEVDYIMAIGGKSAGRFMGISDSGSFEYDKDEEERQFAMKEEMIKQNAAKIL